MLSVKILIVCEGYLIFNECCFGPLYNERQANKIKREIKFEKRQEKLNQRRNYWKFSRPIYGWDFKFR